MPATGVTLVTISDTTSTRRAGCGAKRGAVNVAGSGEGQCA